jgi:hypothetical protein
MTSSSGPPLCTPIAVAVLGQVAIASAVED